MKEKKKLKIIRATTVPLSLNAFCRGLLRELSERYEVIGLSSPGQEMAEIERREGVRSISVPMERRISPFRDVLSLCRLVRVFRRERPSMVHSMTPKAGLLCMMAAWMARVPVRIHTFTGLVWPTAHGLTRRVLMATDWLTCACATHVIPEGQGVLDDLSRGGITRKPMHVLGYGNVRGIDLAVYSPLRPEVQALACNVRRDDCFTFLFVGRIVGDKGIDELLSAYTRLHHRYPSTRLLLVGNYEEALDPISDAAKAIISTDASVVAMGPQYDDALLACYLASDCFVFPSYREGFPNTVIEAGAMGLASIVTDINGSREIVVAESGLSPDVERAVLGLDENLTTVQPEPWDLSERAVAAGRQVRYCANGMVVPPRDADSLLFAMERMMLSDAMRKRMSRRAQRMMADRFDQRFVRQQLYLYYEQVLRAKGLA